MTLPLHERRLRCPTPNSSPGPPWETGTSRATYPPDSSVSVFHAASATRVVHAPGLSPEGGAGVMGVTGIRTILHTMPLAGNWRSNFRVLAMSNACESVDFRLGLHVTGQERIQDPAGSYYCWKVGESGHRVSFG